MTQKDLNEYISEQLGEDSGLRLTPKQARRIAIEMGTTEENLDFAMITVSLETHRDTPTPELKKKLRYAWKEFNEQGGRGVEEADYIDSLHIALAHRSRG